MKCISCKIDVPAQWTAALNSNICPSCGKNIMDEVSKNLLAELRTAMTKMPNDPEGLAGWLLSNYKLRKIGSAEPVEFHRPVESKQEETEHATTEEKNIVEDPMVKEKLIAQKDKNTKFFKRAGVDPIQMKAAADEIKKASLTNEAVDINEIQYEDDMVEDIVESPMSKIPLKKSEMNHIGDIFEASLPPSNATIRLQELQRLQMQQDGTAGESKFRRS